MNYRKFYFSRVVVDRGIRPRHIFMAIVGTIFMAVIVPLGLAGAVGLHIGRVQMQEFEALNKLRQIAQAEEDYRYGVGYGYYGTFEQLVAAKLLAPEFAAPLPTQDSYVFKITLADKDDYGYHLYSLNADP